MLAFGLILSGPLSAQITRGRITSYLERQPSKVYYWTVPLVTPRPEINSGEDFLAVKLRYAPGRLRDDSLLLIKSGCESLDSVVFFYVPSAIDSGVVLLLPSGDTVRYRQTAHDIAAEEGTVENTRLTLKNLSDKLQQYSLLRSKVDQYHSPLDAMAGTALFGMCTMFFITGDENYKGLSAGVSFGTALYCGLTALNRVQEHNSQVDRVNELESELPPGF